MMRLIGEVQFIRNHAFDGFQTYLMIIFQKTEPIIEFRCMFVIPWAKDTRNPWQWAADKINSNLSRSFHVTPLPRNWSYREIGMMTLTKSSEVASKRSTFFNKKLFIYFLIKISVFCNHMLWRLFDRLQVGIFAIFGNVISCMQKSRTISPNGMTITTTYNVRMTNHVWNMDTKNKSNVNAQSRLCKLKMTTQSTMSTKNTQTKR